MRVRHWLMTTLTLAWLGVILWVLGSREPPGGDLVDELFLPSIVLTTMAHFVLYGVLTALLLGWLRAIWVLRDRRLLIPSVAFLIAVMHGGFMELYQATVPGRSPSLEDMLANGAGALTIVVLGRLFVS